MTDIPQYFGTRSPQNWSYVDFCKHHNDHCPDAKACWIKTLDGIFSCSETHNDVLLIVSNLKKTTVGDIRTLPKRPASAQGRRESERISIKEWTDAIKEPWYQAPFKFFNSLLESSKRYFTHDAKYAFNDWIQSVRSVCPKYKFSTQKTFTKDREEYQHLSTIAIRAIPQVKLQYFVETSQVEQDYMWMNIFWQTRLWRVYSDKNRKMEGWLIAFVYAPLMSILLEIPGTLLKMTERKVSPNTMAFDLTEEHDFRHDGLLRILDLDVDVLIMEAKPTVAGSEDDLRKLGIVLSNNILGIQRRFPDIRKTDLRVYGIMFIGYECQLIEARLFEGYPVIYKRLGFNIPQGDEGNPTKSLVSSLAEFITFKRDIERTVNVL
ncbi:hypothetical protein BGX31_003946, partial [Mortierella sp. GBA43]